MRLGLLFVAACLLNAATLERSEKLGGGGQTSIVAMTADRDGNLYIAAHSTAFDLPVRNAFQPRNPGTPIIVSDDVGQSWRPLGVTPDLPYTGVRAPSVNPRDSRILVATGTQGVYRSTDAGETWTTIIDLHDPDQRRRIGYVDEAEWDPVNPNVLYVASTGGVLKSISGGASFTLMTTGLEPGNCCTGAGIALDPFRPSRVVYTINNRAYVSNDSGAIWKPLKAPEWNPFIRIDRHTPDLWFAQASDDLYRSGDAGATWVPLGFPANSLPNLTLDPNTPGRLYAAAGGSFKRSDDGGLTWQTLDFGVGAVSVFSVAIQPGNSNRLVVFGQLNVGAGGYGPNIGLSSNDAGRTWSLIGIQRYIYGLQFDPSRPNRLYAAGGPTSDLYVAKLAPSGETIFRTYIGGQGEDRVSAIAVDAGGAVWLSGTTQSIDFPGLATAPALGKTSGRVFVTKLDANGFVQWSALPQEAASDIPTRLAIGPDGSAYVAGRTAEGFLARVSTSGSVVWSRGLGANSSPSSVALNRGGEILMAGSFDEASNLAKFDQGGNVLWMRTVPAAVQAAGFDTQGNIYVSGTASVDSHAPVSDNAYQREISTNCPHSSGFMGRPAQRDAYMTDLWVASYQPDAETLRYATFLGGTCRETARDLRVEGDGSVWITGTTYSDPFPTVGGAFQPPPPGGSTGFAAHIDSTGSRLLFSSYFPFAVDYGSTEGYAEASDAAGRVYLSQIHNPFGSPLTESWVFKLNVSVEPGSLEIRRVFDTFGGIPAAVSAQEIVTIEMPDFAPAEAVNLGFTPDRSLPLELGGVRVEFDGVPAPLIAVSAGQVSAITPSSIGGREFTSVRVVSGPQRSNEMLLPVRERSFTLWPQAWNSDGTPNSEANPAPAGGFVSLFFTGLGVPDTNAAPDGSVVGAHPPVVTLPFNIHLGGSSMPLPPLQGVPGFVAGIYEARIPVPQSGGPAGYDVSFTVQSGVPPWLVGSLGRVTIYVAPARR